MRVGHTRLPVLIVASGLAFLTTWTVGAQIVTLCALPFAALYVALAAAVVAAATGWRAASSLEPVFLSGEAALPALHLKLGTKASFGRAETLICLVLAALFIVAALIQSASSDFLPLFGVYLATAGYAIYRAGDSSREPLLEMRPAGPATGGVGLSVGTLILAAIFLLFYFFTCVPDADDSLYLNLAVGAKHARDAVYGADSMLGIPGLPIMKSTYRVESMQLLAAALSDLSGLSALQVAHAAIPAFLCVFAAGILALIHCALFRSAWFATALMHFGWLLAMLPGQRSFGHDGITRFFQGKAFFLTAMVPLIATLAVLSVRRPDRAALALLAACLIASIGLTANALYVGPLTVALAAAPLFALGDRSRRIACLRLGFALVYPVMLGIGILLLSPPAPSEERFNIGIGAFLQEALGAPPAHLAALVLVFGASAAALLERRFMTISLSVLIALLLVFNPLLWQAYADHVTGHLNNRLFWATPFPLMLAIASGVLWISVPSAGRIALVALIGAAIASPQSGLYDLGWGFSAAKVPQPDYSIAVQVNALAPCGGLILAPEELSTWITTLEDARPVVEARGIYATQRRAFMPAAQYSARWKLYFWTTLEAGGPVPIDEFRALLQELAVRVVVVRNASRVLAAIRADPVPGDFTLVRELPPFQIFLTNVCPMTSISTACTRPATPASCPQNTTASQKNTMPR